MRAIPIGARSKIARWSASLRCSATVVSERWMNWPISDPAIVSIVMTPLSMSRGPRANSTSRPLTVPPMVTGLATSTVRPARRAASPISDSLAGVTSSFTAGTPDRMALPIRPPFAGSARE